MGLFDMIYVCRYCRKAVKTGMNGKCPQCGGTPIGFGTGSAVDEDKCKLVSTWKKMSTTEQTRWVDKVLRLDAPTPTPSPAPPPTPTPTPTPAPMPAPTPSPAPAEGAWEYEGCITTTETFTNGEIEKYLGVVSGTDIYLIGGLVGGGLANQENLVDSALVKAKHRMMRKALMLGANAVVGASFSLSTSGNTNMIILAITGTAVKVKFNKT